MMNGCVEESLDIRILSSPSPRLRHGKRRPALATLRGRSAPPESGRVHAPAHGPDTRRIAGLLFTKPPVKLLRIRFKHAVIVPEEAQRLDGAGARELNHSGQSAPICHHGGRPSKHTPYNPVLPAACRSWNASTQSVGRRSGREWTSAAAPNGSFVLLCVMRLTASEIGRSLIKEPGK